MFREPGGTPLAEQIRRLYQREPNRIYRIDASKNPDEILEQAIAIIEQYQRQKIE